MDNFVISSDDAPLIIPPIKNKSELLRLDHLKDIFTTETTSVFQRPNMFGHGRLGKVPFESDYYVLPEGRMVVADDILYITKEGKFIPDAYPKAWPYQNLQQENSNNLKLDLSQFAIHKIPGTWFAPNNVPATFHLYHNLVDNLARMYFLQELNQFKGVSEQISIAIPQAFEYSSDMKAVQNCFFEGNGSRNFQRGIYEFDKLIIPPLANKDDHMFVETTLYLSERLNSLVKSKKRTFATRIYVSRADTEVRNLTNDFELSEELKKFGFLTICPGEYSIATQLEIFSGAEIIVGIHGMGLMPMLVSNSCKAILEFEALGWPATAFKGLASVLGIEHIFAPCKKVEDGRTGLFDWAAVVDIPGTIEIIKRFI